MSSTHTGILLHLVFSTKQRFPLIKDEWRGELFSYIGGTIKNHKASLISAGGIEDHIHLLLRIHPAFAISETVKLLKANSSRWIGEQRKVLCHFEWQKGDGAFSVSQSMAQVVTNYLARQREHHRNQDFRAEYIEMLDKHQIEYDPQYLFDDEFLA